MKRILLWGGDSWVNHGDSAILSATIASLKQCIPEAELLVTSARPKETSKLHNVPSIKRTPGGMLKAIARCDLLLWGGGQLLQNASSKPFLFLQFCLLLTAKLMRKKVMCYAQGIGPITDPVSRSLAGTIVGSLDRITVRDLHSYNELKALGIRADLIQITADPAVDLEQSSEERTTAIMEDEGVTQPFVVVSLRRWGHYKSNWLPVSFYTKASRWPAGHAESFQRFLGDMARLADHIVFDLKAQVLFLPMSPGGDQGDDIVAEAALLMMKQRESAAALRGKYHPSELKALLGKAELVVGLRTHSVILACSAGTPAVAISYSSKGKSFMEALDLVKYSISFERASFDNLWPMVKDAWTDRESLSSHLSTVMPILQLKAKSNALIAKDLLDSNTDAHLQSKLADEFSREARTWSGYYDGTGSIARPFISGSLAARKRAILSLVNPRPNQKVLDLGCGPGVYGDDLLSEGARWYGMDISGTMLNYARVRLHNHPGSAFVQGSSAFIPVKTNSVDVVICSGVADYLSKSQLSETVSEIQRVLRPGGVLCITANLPDPLRWLRSRAPAWLPAPLKVIGPAYFHSNDLIAELEKSGLSAKDTIRLPSKPFGGTLIIKAIKSGNPTPAMESAVASRQLL